MEIVCKRFYGEPKLKKPSYLNNKTLLGSITYHRYKNVKCKVWKVEDNYYILHRDWFSQVIDFQKAKDIGLIDDWNKKFVYNDNFAGCVLRNEAIIRISRDDWYNGWCMMAKDNLCISFAKMLNQEHTEFMQHEWEYLFEQFITLANINHFDTESSNNITLLKRLR